MSDRKGVDIETSYDIIRAYFTYIPMMSLYIHIIVISSLA